MKRQLFFFGIFLQGLYHKRFLVRQMVKRDFQLRYLGSYLGLFWAFAQPLIMLLVIWFAFTYGLRITDTPTGHPFALWLICGLVPWQFLQESLSGGANALVSYGYLIKKTAFSPGILPLIKLISSFILHLPLLLIVLLWAWAAGYPPGWHWLQLPYYLLASLIMLAGWGWLLGGLTVFVRDIGMATQVGLTLLFWLTPVFWAPELVPAAFRPLIWANPLYFLIHGYRSTLLDGSWFFEMPGLNLYAWGVSGLIFVVGAWVFQRLRPHFTDVL
jgi:lipopolysaccharide transport system permease protein/teichoic acid transport system permease protein